MKNSKIIIFTLNGCDHCQNLKNRLDEHSISYTEVEINENEELWEEILKVIKHEALPTTLILENQNKESSIYIPGIDYETEDEIVEIIRSYM